MKSWVFLFSGHKERVGGAEMAMTQLAQRSGNMKLLLLKDPTSISTITLSEVIKSRDVNYQVFGIKALLLSLFIPGCNRKNRFIAIRGSDKNRPFWKSIIYIFFRPLCKGWISNSKRALEEWDCRCEVNKINTYIIRNLVVYNNKFCIIPSKGFFYRLIVVANEKPKKGLEFLPELIEKLNTSGIRVHVDVFGETNGTIINENTKYFGEQLFMQGWSNGILEKLANFDGVLSLSESEGLPQTIVSAVDLGLPIFALDSGVISVIVENGINGIICPDLNCLSIGIMKFYTKLLKIKRLELPKDFNEEEILSRWNRLSI